jgi:hypothetical protein
MIKSVVRSDTTAIRAILKLHCKSPQIDLDPTYSTGGFYKKGIRQPTIKYDINPQANGVLPADVRALPLADESVETIIFDPPFLATSGPSLKLNNTSNKLNKRFGVYSDEASLHTMYTDALKELYRVCKKGGVLIFKCQDKVSSGIQYFSHCFIYNEAIKTGWYPADLFIKIVKTRLVADWQKANQKNARKHHCYFFVFKKIKKGKITNGVPVQGV